MSSASNPRITVTHAHPKRRRAANLPRCSECGEPRGADVVGVYVPCPRHRQAELVQFTRSQEWALWVLDGHVRGSYGPPVPVEEIQGFASTSPDIAKIEDPAGSALAALYLSKWGHLPEKGSLDEIGREFTPAGLWG